MMLQALVDRAVAEPGFPTSRKGPLKSHIKRYAACLGCEPPTCPPERYHLSPEALDELLERTLPTTYSRIYRRNIRQDVVALLELAVARRWIPALPTRLQSWRTVPPRRELRKALPKVLAGRDQSAYALGVGPRWVGRPKAGETRAPAPSLAAVAPLLAQDLDSYVGWCTPKAVKGRSRKIYKRPTTLAQTRSIVARVGGYAVNILGREAKTLTLRDLCAPDLLEQFSWWYIARCGGKRTATLRRSVSEMATIARHFYRDEACATALWGIIQSDELPEEEPVKSEVWLDLEMLDAIGESLYPFNAQRQQENYEARRIAQHLLDPRITLPHWQNLKYRGIWVAHALMLQLWTHRPFRQRNIREMKLGKNLIAEPGGSYRLHFEGDELKVDRRRYKGHQTVLNVSDSHFPRRLLPRLHEWLTVWRPRLVPSPDFPYVFCSANGTPILRDSLTIVMKRHLGMFTASMPGGPYLITPHMLRVLWTTQMLIAGLDILTVAKLLGDTLQVVYHHYLIVDKSRPVSPWTRQLAKQIAEGTD
jgi:hypothetical protein